MLRIASRIARSFAASMTGTLRDPPHQGAVVGGHRVVGGEPQPALLRQSIERLEIPHAAGRIALPEIMVEGGVALAGVLSPETERSIHAQHPGAREHGGSSAKKLAHRAPSHDVQSVGT